MEDYKALVRQMKKDVNTFMTNYDTNKDGKVTRAEMVECLKKTAKYPEYVADYLFEDDTDGDGVMTLEEVKQRVLKIEEEKIDAILDYDVKKYLEANDTNGDNEITKDELIAQFSKVKALDAKAMVDCLFELMDLNKDGKITPNELREFNKSSKFSF